MIFKPNLEENGFVTKSERVMGACLVGFVNFMIVFSIIPLSLFIYMAWWILLPVAIISACLISPAIFKKPAPTILKETKKCVMCNIRLRKQDESKTYKNAHEWCETYY